MIGDTSKEVPIQIPAILVHLNTTSRLLLCYFALKVLNTLTLQQQASAHFISLQSMLKWQVNMGCRYVRRRGTCRGSPILRRACYRRMTTYSISAVLPSLLSSCPLTQHLQDEGALPELPPSESSSDYIDSLFFKFGRSSISPPASKVNHAHTCPLYRTLHVRGFASGHPSFTFATEMVCCYQESRGHRQCQACIIAFYGYGCCFNLPSSSKP